MWPERTHATSVSKEEDNLNESSGEDEEMYSWDELKYKANFVCFISNKSTEK